MAAENPENPSYMEEVQIEVVTEQPSANDGSNDGRQNEIENGEKNDINNGESTAMNIEYGNELPGDGPYEKVYRTGNFGEKLGMVNQENGLRWMKIHTACMALMFIFNIIGSVMLKYYYGINILSNLAMGLTWAIWVLGASCAAVGLYFFMNLKTLRRPFALFMTMRFFAIFTWTAVLLGITFVLIILGSKKNMLGTESEIAGMKTIYSFIAIIMILEMVISFMFVCGPSCADICKICMCCEMYCIYSEGQEIAPGVANPPSQQRWEQAATVLQAVNKELN